MTGQITLIFQYSLQGAPRQARAGLHAGAVLVGQSRPACAHKQGGGVGAGGPPRGEAAPLTRHRPGSGVGAPRPGRCCTRCGRGLAGAPLGRRPRRWLLDTGSRALRGGKGESRAEAFRSTPVVQGNPPTQDPSPCRRGWTPAPCLGGGVPKAGSREEVKVRFQSGLVKACSLCPREYGE